MADLPTDNLYKFIALAGLALAFVSISFPFRYRQAFLKELDALDEQLQIFRVDLQYHRARIQMLKQSVVAAVDALKAGVGKPDAAAHEQKADEIENETAEMERRQIRANVRADALKRTQRELKMLQWIMAFGITFGLTLAALGFTLWYVKAQRYQDLAAQTAATKPAG